MAGTKVTELSTTTHETTQESVKSQNNLMGPGKTEPRSNFKQVRLLLWKNYKLRRKSKKSTCCEFFCAILVFVFLGSFRSMFSFEENIDAVSGTSYETLFALSMDTLSLEVNPCAAITSEFVCEQVDEWDGSCSWNSLDSSCEYSGSFTFSKWDHGSNLDSSMRNLICQNYDWWDAYIAAAASFGIAPQPNRTAASDSLAYKTSRVIERLRYKYWKETLGGYSYPTEKSEWDTGCPFRGSYQAGLMDWSSSPFNDKVVGPCSGLCMYEDLDWVDGELLKYFSNMDEMVAYASSSEYAKEEWTPTCSDCPGRPLGMGLIFDSISDDYGDVEYTLKFNNSQVPNTEQNLQSWERDGTILRLEGYDRYLKSGAIGLQYYIDVALAELNLEATSTNDPGVKSMYIFQVEVDDNEFSIDSDELYDTLPNTLFSEMGLSSLGGAIQSTIQGTSADLHWKFNVTYEINPQPYLRIFVEFTDDESAIANLYDDITNNLEEYITSINGGLSATYSGYSVKLVNVIATYAVGTNSRTMEIGVFDFPIAGYFQDTYQQSIGWMIPLLFFAALVYSFSITISTVVHEKAAKITEGMKMMGASSFTLWMSHYVYAFCLALWVSFWALIIFKLMNVYRYTDGFILFVWIFLFTYSSSCLAIMISTVFDNKKTASQFGSVVFFVLMLAGMFNLSTDVALSLGMFSPIVFSVCCKTVAAFEVIAVGLTFDNWDVAVQTTYQQGISMQSCLNWMFFDIFLYKALTWYLDKVFPSKYGVKKPFYFCCTKSYWSQIPQEYFEHEEAIIKDSEMVQDYKREDDPSIELRGLTKTFGDFTAVNALDMKVYPGEIFCLLGHNGAGKTTTISMLTGLIPITTGSARVNGSDVKTAIEEVRKSMGLCPQHNVLWDEVTVIDHMYLYAGLKGVPKDMIENEVVTLINKVGLKEKMNSPAGTLSGGQKRKLSLVIALCGGSKILFLDEVTSGMDPSSRRDTWELLKEVKNERTIILTTHFMDEADYLADRIAIMTHGQVACMGTSLFLKEQYGVGYSFVISLNQNVAAHDMRKTYDDIINKYIEKVENLSMAASELSYRLPFESSGKIPGLLRELDERKEEIQFLEYGISVTTLEEVFMKVGEVDLQNDRASLRKQLSGRSKKLGEQEGTVDRQTTEIMVSARSEERSHSLIFVHIYAMLYKKFWWTSRDKRALSCSFIVPIILLLVGLTGMQIQIPTSYPDRTLEDMATEFEDGPIPYNEFNSNGSAVKFYTSTYENATQDQLRTFSAYIIDGEETVEFEFNAKLLQSPDAIGIALKVSTDDSDYDMISTSTHFSYWNYGDSAAKKSALWKRTTDFRVNLTGIDCSGTSDEWHHVDLTEKGYTTTTSANSLYYESDDYKFDYRDSNNDGGAARTSSVNFLIRRPFVTTTNGEENYQFSVGMDSVTVKLLSVCAGGVDSSDPCTSDPFTAWDVSAYPDVYVQCQEIDMTLTGMNIYASDLHSSMASRTTDFGPLTAYGDTIQQYRDFQDEVFLAGYKTKIYEEGLPKTVDEYSYVGLYIQPGNSSDTLKFGIGSNVSAFHGLPIAENLAVNLFKATYGSGAISTSMSPFKATVAENEFYNQLNAFMTGTYISLAFCIIPAGIMYNIVWESSSQVKHQQYVSGVSPAAFWLGEWIFDFIIFIPVSAFATILLILFDVESLVGEAATVVFLLAVMYGFAVVPFTFLMSRFFSGPAKAQMVIVMSFMSVTLILILFDFMVNILAEEGDNVYDVNKNLSHLWRLFPPFLLGNSILGLSTRDMFWLHPNGLGVWDWTVSGRSFLYLFWEGPAYFLLNLLVEYAVNNPALRTYLCLHVNQPKDPEKLDSDVEAERNRIAELVAGGVNETLAVKYPIIISRLRQVFSTGSSRYGTSWVKNPNKVAVKDVSYCIPRGEIFGFLGVNGAGKTTTLKLLTGIFPPSEGTAFLNGYPITDQTNVRRSVGYCPQFDALFDLLTAKETIKLYGLIKGLNSEQLEEQSKKMIDSLLLTEYQDKCAGTYSGGNKRKLSVSIALIGNPPIVFLDEPSTGIDPVARRFMWNFISNTMQGRSVILTTHSMEECEALCHRIGILVNGQLTCIGTSQHLKSKFGKGYEITIIMSSSADEATIIGHFSGIFQSVRKQECVGTTLKVKIDKGAFELPDIFERLIDAQGSLRFTSFAVQQTSLEQVFIRMAGLDKKNGEDGLSSRVAL